MAEPGRARIARLLDGARTRRLTLVVAGSGYGKTTALRALEAPGRLDLTTADRDVNRLAARLAERLGLAPAVDPAGVGAPTGADDRMALADALAADLASRLAEAGEVVIVLDDADQLGDELGPAWQFLRTLLLQANVHLVLSGRRLPDAHALLGHDRDVGRIGADELACTPVEIRSLLGEQVGDDVVAACASITAGWPVAVALIRDRLERTTPAEALASVEALRSDRGTPWRAIARTVVDDEPPESARILAIAEAAGVVEADLLSEIGVDGTDLEARLNGLQQRGLLVAASAPGWFGLSPVLTGSVPPSADAPLWREVAAARLDQVGQRALALACHQRIGTDSVRAYLRAAGGALIDAGQARLVVDALREGTGADPELAILLGRAAQLTGDLDGAIEAFGTAERALPDHALPAGAAWRYAALLYLRGDVDTALAALTAAEPAAVAADEALVAAWRASCLWSAGELDEAQVWADRGLAAALESKDPTARAAAHSAVGLVAVSRGDAAANSRHQRRALRAAIEAGDTVQEARIRANLCAVAAGEGDFVRALAEADAAVVAARGFSVLTGHALGNRAQALESLGRLDEARAAAADALDSFATTGSVMGAAAHLVVAGIDRERGDLVKARIGFQLAITLSDTIGDVHTAAFARASLALVVAVDDPAAARRLAAEAIEQSSDTERPAALVAAAFAELVAHEPGAAIERAGAAETAALAAGDFGALAQAWEIRAVASTPPDVARLDAALARWDELGSAVAALRCRLLIARVRGDAVAERAFTADLTARGLAVDCGLAGQVASGLDESAAVRVVTLGRFQVIRGAEVVALTEWQSRKARDLLKLLIARRGRPVTREAAADALWPDEDGAALGNRLSVLLSTVRRVLDPGRAHEADHFIAADGVAIAVRTERLGIDVIELLDTVRQSGRLAADAQADAAEALLRRAEQLYQGDFLAEDPYADWAVECREEALDAAQSVLRQLARAEALRGDDEAALAHLRRLLERDVYDEQAWLALVGALIRLRRHGEARRLHARYARYMRELDVAPSPLDGLARRRP